ncbi:MAG: DNA polymerase III subunit delta [Clostridia bacterium]|nr:DNA polymerase III subunit delta [Clostridia bacterium]
MAKQAPLTILKDADFRKEIKNTPAAGYLLFGEEDYLKNIGIEFARETLCPDQTTRAFNEIILDALDFTPERLLDALGSLPMLADRKIIVLRGLNFTAMRQSEIDALCAVLEQLPEYDYNTLLIPVAAGAIDEGYLPKRPSALLSRLGELLHTVQYERCTPAKLMGWVGRHFAHNGVEASPELCAKVIDVCGRNMHTLATEIDKISYYARAHGRELLTEQDITAAACVTMEFDAFAFANALTDRNHALALSILSDMKFRRVEPTVILGEVIRVSCDLLAIRRMSTEGRTVAEMAKVLSMHEYKVGLYTKSASRRSIEELQATVAACAEADTALKLSPQGYTVLERLICREG